MAVRDKRPSQFGGVPGRVQPAPHEPTNAETLGFIYATEPAPAIALTDTVEDTVPETQRKR